MLEKLLSKIHGSVFLTIDGHKVFLETVEKYLKEKDPNYTDEIDDDLFKRMREMDKIYELHFYPVSPSSFCIVWGTSLEEVVEKALTVFDKN